MIDSALAGGVSARAHGRTLRLLVAAARPRQWTKNLVLVAALVFAGRLGDADSWGKAATAVAAFSLASSAAYLLTDQRDAEDDRPHPTKRERPLASGALSPRAGLALCAGLAAAAVAAAAALGPHLLLFLGSFLAGQLAYTLGLKRVVGLDVATIAALFVVRAAAGAAAVQVRISPWLLACTALLALFLAMAKRRAELVLVHAEATPGRAVLASYSLRVLDRLLDLAAAATVLAYAAYAFTARDSAELATTLPFVVVALLRYRFLVRRRGAGEEPDHLLLTDVPILVSVCAWVLSAALVLTLS